MINRLAESRHLDISPWLLIVGGSAVSVVAAEVLLIGFDEPVRKWLSRLRSRRDLREALQAG
jgi:peptidoglycan/LPS O-acetylase OafA/YrhL